MQRLIRFDWAIKRLLRNKVNFVILEGFLSVLLNDDIKIENILESESNQQTGDNKSNRVDLLIKNQKGELVIIEVQSNRMPDYLMRMLYGTSKLIVDNLDKGQNYNEIKKVISVNIVYFDLGHGTDYLYHGTTQFKGMRDGDTLMLSKDQEKVYHNTEIAKIYPEYYLIKVNQFDDKSESSLEQWIYFLKNEEIKDSFNAKGLQEAKEELNVLKLSNEELKDYDAFIKDWRDQYSLTVGNYNSGKIDGFAEGEAIGIKKGEEKLRQKQIDIAIKCLKRGMTLAEIIDISDLTEEEVLGIKKDSGLFSY